MSDLFTFRRRPKRLVVVFTVTVLLGIGSFQVIHLELGRQRALASAETEAANLAFLLSVYVADSFALIDTSLRQLALHGRRIGGPGAPVDAWSSILSASRATLEGGGSLSVTDATGIIRHSTIPALVGEERRGSYIYQQLSGSSRDELVIDRPFLSLTEPKQYIIPLGRRLTTDTGGFDGLVVATLTPSKYRDFLRAVDVGVEGIIWVFHPDGLVLFREPSTADPIDGPTHDHPLAEATLGSGTSGITRAPQEPGGPMFISAHRTVDAPPFIVAVSLSEEEILANWRRERLASALAFLALAATLGAIVAVAFRQMDGRARAEKALIDIRQVEADRLRDTNQQLEEALEREHRARREAEAANYLKDQFLMTVSHELRTPLTAIFGWVRMLLTTRLPAEEQSRALTVVERNAVAQARLIDDLLDASHAITGKLRIDRRRVNVGRVVRAAVETVRPSFQAKSIRFDLEIDPRTPDIPADAGRLQQIVWNLLSNAIKFTPEGGTVRLDVRPTASHVEISVRDDGAGITPEFLPYVFERFHQAEAGTRRRYGGLGLGLAIVRHLVELHGGKVTAESEGEGKGATFRVALPISPAPT